MSFKDNVDALDVDALDAKTREIIEDEFVRGATRWRSPRTSENRKFSLKTGGAKARTSENRKLSANAP